MPLADSNIWLALAVLQHPFHRAARNWFGGLTQARSVFFCRSTQQSFLRLLTTRAVFVPFRSPPLRNRAAWSVYEGLAADRLVAWTDEPPGLLSHWKRLTDVPRASPKMWMDAYLAAFAIAGRHRFVTTDKAFLQYKGLDVLVLTP